MALPHQHTVATPYIVGPVHFYSVTLGGELVLFDCGPPTKECKDYLKQHLDLSQLCHVILTHGHVDHWGQALWLAEQGATIYIPYADHLKILHHRRHQQELLSLLKEMGFSPILLRYFTRLSKEDFLYSTFIPGYKIVEQDLPDELGIRFHACPGHSVSDMVYEGDGWLISGDTLLKGVFPSPLLDIDLVNGGRFQNYQAWCASLISLSALDGTSICPGHREKPESIRNTLFEYLQTLLYRVDCFLPYRKEADLMIMVERVLQGRIKGPLHIYMKASEIVFMQDFLKAPDCLRQALIKIGLYEEFAEPFEKVVR